MSAAPADRIKLATGATTIIKAPISRAKSRTGDGAFAAALPGPSRDQAGEVTDSAHVYDGIKPPRPPGPLGPWHDAAAANQAISLRAAEPMPGRGTHPLSSVAAAALGRGPSTRRLSLAPAPAAGGKPSAVSASGAAPGGFGAQAPGGGGVSFRRPGVTSAPVAFFSDGGAAGAVSAQDGAGRSSRLLPAIASGSMCSRSSANQPGSPSSAPAQSPARQPSRSFVSLPSLGGGGGGAAVGEDTPIVVSFASSRGTSKKAMLSGVSRAGRSLTGAALASAAAAEVEDDDDGGTAPAATSAAAGGGIHRRLSKVPMNGVGGGGGGGAPPAAPPPRNPQDDTVRQDDKASAMALSTLSSYPPAAASAVLLASHQREQERVNRVRSSLLGAAPDGVVRIAEEARRVSGSGQGTQVMPAGASAARGGVDRVATVPPAAVPEPVDEDFGELTERGLRSGKSFTQRALEDPNSPMFKTAKQLVKLQEQLSYMDDKDWREKAAETVPMERPILMAEGWKL